MGALESFLNILGGSGRKFVDIPLEPGESVVVTKLGCVLVGGLSVKGGQIQLTDRRLLFRPWNTADVADLLAAGLSKAGAPTQGVNLVGYVQKLNTAGQWRTDQIVSVASGGPPSVWKPPSILLGLGTGQTIELGVLATHLTPNFSNANIPPREELLTALQMLLAAPPTHPAAGGAPAQVARSPFDAPAEEMEQLRNRAISTGRPVEAGSDDGGRFYFAPDGVLHFDFDYDTPRPAAATNPSNLCGVWVIEHGASASTHAGDPSYFELLSSGALSGHLEVFGVLPPLDIKGAWWWLQDKATLSLTYRVAPAADLIVVEGTSALRVSSLEPDRIAGDDAQLGALILRRTAP